jgi:hypothetical protein
MYPLRLAIGDFKREISNKNVLKLTKRAAPFEFNNYKVAKLVISIVSNTDPFTLFHDLLSQAVVEGRRPLKPWFLDMSRTRKGRQAIANRVSTIMKQVLFDWLDVPLSNDSLRKQLKSSFFQY